MKALWKWIYPLFITALVMVAALLCYFRLGKDFAKEIRSRKLLHTDAGWVNFGHANPTRVKLFVEDLRSRWKSAHGRPFEITYGQQMEGRYFGIIGVQAKLERSFRITDVSTQLDLDRIAWGIFRDVTEAFETMQGDFPNALDAASQDSSFRNGDLLGNRIAFYRALRNYSSEQVNEWIHSWSVGDSLRQFHQRPFEKSRHWEVASALVGGPLDDIPHNSVWFAQHASLLTEKQFWFRFHFLSRN